MKVSCHYNVSGIRVIELDNKYRIMYDSTNNYPEFIARRNDSRWKDVSNDDVIAKLCEALWEAETQQERIK